MHAAGIYRALHEDENSLTEILPHIRCTSCWKPTSYYHEPLLDILRQGGSAEEAFNKFGMKRVCCRMTLMSPLILSSASDFGADADIFEGFKSLDISPKPASDHRTFRGMRIVNKPPPPVASFSVPTTVSRQILIPLSDDGEGADSSESSTSSAPSSTQVTAIPDDYVEDPRSGLKISGHDIKERKIGAWADAGEGYIIPILRGSYTAR